MPMTRFYAPILLIITVCLTMTSCASTCEIFGSNSNPSFEDKKVALVPENNGDFDGSEETITHGTFIMTCTGGAPQLCRITVGGDPVGFMVVENGKLDMDLDKKGNATVSGTNLNNKLARYLSKMNAIEFELARQDLLYTSATIFDGDPDGILHREFQARCRNLLDSRRELQTEFITSNFDNVLGKNFFIQLLDEPPTPERKAQVEQILKKAPKNFKGDEDIKRFVRQAGYKF